MLDPLHEIVELAMNCSVPIDFVTIHNGINDIVPKWERSNQERQFSVMVIPRHLSGSSVTKHLVIY